MSRKSRFYTYRAVLLFFLQIQGIYSSNSKSVLERFKYLEKRINTESKFRDEDFLDIIERLDRIDSRLNKTLEDRTSTGDKTEKKVNNEYSEIVENLHIGYNRIRTAFSEEKYVNERIRRQIPKLENNLTSVKRDLQEYCLASINRTELLSVKLEKSAESVATNVEKANSSLQEAVQKWSIKVGESVESVATNVEKVNSSLQEAVQKWSIKVGESVESVATNVEKANSSLQEAVRKWSIKVEESVESVRSEVAGRLLEVSKRVESVESLVINLTNILQQINTQTSTIDSCLAYRDFGNYESGIYKIRNRYEVYCDQTTERGGWTVFQKRLNGETDFYRTWHEYKIGFGDLNGEFWRGNELLHMLTADGDHELRIDMEDFEGNKAYAKYSKFRIHGEDDMYRLEVSGFSGNAGDSLAYHNGMQFSTSDIDNDEHDLNCAQTCSGAWWYNRCHYSNLNGKYYNEAGKVSGQGIVWYQWKQNKLCLKTVEMKFR